MKGQRGFYSVVLSTLVAVYILILVGGVVRSSGSGMGCPDWPKCFGNWVPPTSVDQLPSDYKEIYSDYRSRKNERFAKYLNALGMHETASKILNDKSIREERDFNPVKTWIEYVNRIVGVVIGLLIFWVAVKSLKFWKTQRSWTIIGIASFLLVGFQGWIGSVVVSTNLTPWTISVHMILALVIVLLLVYLLFHSREAWAKVNSSTMIYWLVGCMIVLFIQIIIGTQVREEVDKIAAAINDRKMWVSELGMAFLIHRSFSWLVLILHVVLIVKLLKSEVEKRFTLSLILLILGSILSGVGMAWFAIPPVLQPIHLLLATVTFGLQFLLLLRLTTRAEKQESVA